MSIRKTVEKILIENDVRTQNDFVRFKLTIGGLKGLYDMVREADPVKWDSIKTPKNSVRFYYQKVLKGYKICPDTEKEEVVEVQETVDNIPPPYEDEGDIFMDEIKVLEEKVMKDQCTCPKWENIFKEELKKTVKR